MLSSSVPLQKKDKPKTYRTRQLIDVQKKKLKYFMRVNTFKNGGYLIAKDINRYIHKALHLDYKLRDDYRIMHVLEIS